MKKSKLILKIPGGKAIAFIRQRAIAGRMVGHEHVVVLFLIFIKRVNVIVSIRVSYSKIYSTLIVNWRRILILLAGMLFQVIHNELCAHSLQ